MNRRTFLAFIIGVLAIGPAVKAAESDFAVASVWTTPGEPIGYHIYGGSFDNPAYLGYVNGNALQSFYWSESIPELLERYPSPE